MKYLEQVHLLVQTLKILKMGTREQIGMRQVQQVSHLIKQAELKGKVVDDNDIEITVIYQDLLITLENLLLQGLEILPYEAKETLTCAIFGVLTRVSVEAYTYYEVHHFDETPQIISLIHNIVRIVHEGEID